MTKITLAGLAGLLFSTSIYANDVVALNDVVVTATRFPETEPRTPGNVSIITKEDIENTPAIGIPDLLKTQAGIDVSSFYGNQGIDANVDIRGFGDAANSNTLILLDGQRLNPVDGGTIQWSTIPLQALQRIEVIRGGGSVLYGDRASGGVINLITDKSGKPGASLTASVGSFDYRALDGFVAGGNDNAYFNSYLHSADANGYRDNAQSNQLILSGRGGVRNGMDDTFIDYAVYRVANGLPGSLGSAAFHDHPRRSRTPDDSQVKQGFRLRPGVSLALTDRLRLDAEIAVSGEHYDFENPSFGAGSTSERSLHTVSFTPRVNWQHGLGSLASQTVAGLDYYYGRVNADASSFASQDARQISKAVYLQNTTSLTDKLDLTAGIRSQNMQQQASQDAFDSGFFVTPGIKGSSDRTRSVYDLGVNYQATQWSAYAKIGSSFRFANTDELFGFDAFFNPVFAGDIKPQYGRNREIGARFNNGSMNGAIALFQSKIEDEIGFDGNLGINTNLDPTVHQGIETELGWAISDDVQAKLAYSHIEAEFRSGIYDGNRLPSVPDDKANLQLIWDAGKYGKYTTQANYVGTRYSSGDFANTLDRQGGYTTFDLRASWDLRPWQLSLAALNVFDKRYSTFAVFSAFRNDYFYFPNDGQSFYLSARYDFK